MFFENILTGSLITFPDTAYPNLGICGVSCKTNVGGTWGQVLEESKQSEYYFLLATSLSLHWREHPCNQSPVWISIQTYRLAHPLPCFKDDSAVAGGGGEATGSTGQPGKGELGTRLLNAAIAVVQMGL